MIKTVIFDFSGVLVEEVTLELQAKYHFDRLSQKKRNQYLRAVNASNVGKLPTSRLLQVIHRTLVTDIPVKELLRMHVWPKPLPAIKLLQKLRRQGYKVIIFSNHQKTWPKQIAKNLNIDLTGIPFLNSSWIGMDKPHMNYYRYMIKKCGVDPKQSVFIDDRTKNLVPAKKLGMKTFHYHNNYGELVKYLKKLGIKGL